MRVRSASVTETALHTEQKPRFATPERFRLVLGQPSAVWALRLLPSRGLGECRISIRVGPTAAGMRTIYTFEGYSAHNEWLTFELDPFRDTKIIEIRVRAAETAFVWTCMHVYISTQSGQPHSPTSGSAFPVPGRFTLSKARSLPELFTKDAIRLEATGSLPGRG